MRRFTRKRRALVALATAIGATLLAAAAPLTAMAANWGP
jgi:hypothetical protein